MQLIDSHCHLEKFAQKGTVDAVINSACDAGVGRLITIGTSIEDWALYRDLSVKYTGIVDWTVGIHPCNVDEEWRDQANGFISVVCR